MCAKWEKEARWKALFVFTAVLHRLLKSPFAAAAPLFSFSKPAPPQTNNKHCQRDGHSYSSSQKFLGLFFFWGGGFHMTKAFEFSGPEINPSRCQPLCARVCRDTCNEQIWCWFLGAAFALISACLQAFSVTCCISLAFRTSIRHDKVTPSSGINTGAHFHLHTKGLKSSMQSSVVWFS